MPFQFQRSKSNAAEFYFLGFDFFKKVATDHDKNDEIGRIEPQSREICQNSNIFWCIWHIKEIIINIDNK